MCAAELMNLLNVGYAASQFHDGSVPVGDSGLFLRGIQKQPLVKEREREGKQKCL